MTDESVPRRKAMKLTAVRLAAIVEALNARLAGELDIEADRSHYEGALAWAQQWKPRRKHRK